MAEEEQLGLRELLDLAQTALEEGRHQEATVACRHVLRDYPDSITAMRLLGESYLEAGRADESGRAFEKVLASDPFNVLARVGLGVLAEDRGEDERAIAQFRLAWEAAPALPQLRSELVRLYRKRYGVGGRLRMTRVALANLQARNEDLPRALRQLAILHAEEPARLDVAIARAEALWRHGDDAEAAALCRALLADRPRLARPALVLAALLGDGAVAAAGSPGLEEVLATARAVDPDAVLARELVALRPSGTLERFVAEAVPMTPFDPATLDIAGTDELLGSRTGTTGEEAFRWEDVAGGLLGESSLKAGTSEIGAATNGLPPLPSLDDDVDALFAAIDRQLATVNVDDEAAPFVPPAEEGSDEIAAAGGEDEPLAGWETPADDELAPAPDEPTAVERLTANWDNIDNELAAATPTDDAPIGVTGMLSALGDLELDLKPFDVENDAEPAFEDTLTFDPSKFSLPPLDGEEDDDLALDEVTGDLAGEVAPFNLDETGPRVKTGGLTFAELVRAGEAAPTSYAAGNGFTDQLGDAESALADITSIFATRELSPLPEDRVLDVQVAATETLPPRGGASLASPALPADDAGAAADTGDGGTAWLTGEDEGDAPAAPAVEAEAEVPPTGLLDEVAAEVEAPMAAPAPAPMSFEALLSADAPRLELPEATFFPDATRPLLADDAALLGLEVPAEAPAPSPAPEPAAEPGMDNLFNRLRHRKQERIETGELQVNRRLKSAPRPILGLGEAAPATEPVAAEAGVAADAAVAPDFAATPQATAEAAGPEATANLDDWILSLDHADLDAPTATTGETRDDPAPLSGDDWLDGLVTSPAAEVPAWAAPAAPRADDGVSTDGGTTHDDWHHASGRDAAGAWASGESSGGATQARNGYHETRWDVAPEQPAPIVGPLAEAAPYTNGHAPGTNGHAGAPHAEPPVESPAAPPPAVAAPATPRQAAHEPAEQIAALEAMVAADPQNGFARLTLAVAYGSTQPEQALNEYRRLIKEASDLIPEVVERLKEMIADGDAPPRAHRVLGDAYMKLGQFDLAMAEFQRALSARPRAAKG